MVKFEKLVRDTTYRLLERSGLCRAKGIKKRDEIVFLFGHEQKVGPENLFTMLEIEQAESGWQGCGVPFRNYYMMLIFDYQELNKYGKIIFENSRVNTQAWSTFIENHFFRGNSSLPSFEMAEKSRREFDEGWKEIVERAIDEIGADWCQSVQFIFWALMILAVDKNNYEEKLSLICDFARMFKLSDDEVLDIVKVIKKIFLIEEDLIFVTESIPGFLCE